MDLHPPVTLYHLALNHALYNKRRRRPSTFPLPPITYHDNLHSIVAGYTQYRYVSPEARHGIAGSKGHDVYKDWRGFHVMPPSDASAFLFGNLRPPFNYTHEYENYFPHTNPSPTVYYATHKTPEEDERRRRAPGSIWGMPKLEYLAFPQLTYSWMMLWAQGILPLFGEQPLPTPMVLDMAHMCSMSGGSFYPGIEVGRDASKWRNWVADFGANKHHIDIRFKGSDGIGGVGELTRLLACPWQADFLLCTNEYWPASRPIQVTQDGLNFYDWITDGTTAMTKDDLLSKWAKLGFIRYQATGEYFEESRMLAVPPFVPR
jgi:hypothetical protein